MFHYLPEWYASMVEGQEIVTLNLKDAQQRRKLDQLLAEADLLIAANRPAALERLGLGWDELHQNFPSLEHGPLLAVNSPDSPSFPY